MVNEFHLWAEAQAALASAFMVPAMWRAYRVLGRGADKHSTPALLALWICLHGVFGTVMFGALATATFAVAPATETASTIRTVIALTALPLFAVKSALVWLGEERGRRRLWRVYLYASAAWAALMAAAAVGG